MLETKDLILDKAKPEDWDHMYRNVWSRPSSFRYMGYELSPDEEHAQERMRRTANFQASPEGRDIYIVYLKETKEAIGFAGIAPVEGAAWEERGICIGPDFWGLGYATQILNCLINLARERGAKEFIYSSWEENAVSRHLADKAGFTQYAAERHVRPYDGQEYTLIKYRKNL